MNAEPSFFPPCEVVESVISKECSIDLYQGFENFGNQVHASYAQAFVCEDVGGELYEFVQAYASVGARGFEYYSVVFGVFYKFPIMENDFHKLIENYLLLLKVLIKLMESIGGRRGIFEISSNRKN